MASPPQGFPEFYRAGCQRDVDNFIAFLGPARNAALPARPAGPFPAGCSEPHQSTPQPIGFANPDRDPGGAPAPSQRGAGAPGALRLGPPGWQGTGRMAAGPAQASTLLRYAPPMKRHAAVQSSGSASLASVPAAVSGANPARCNGGGGDDRQPAGVHAADHNSSRGGGSGVVRGDHKLSAASHAAGSPMHGGLSSNGALPAASGPCTDPRPDQCQVANPNPVRNPNNQPGASGGGCPAAQAQAPPAGGFLDAGDAPDAPPVLLFDLNGTLTSHTSMRRSAGRNRMRPGTHHLRRLQVRARSSVHSPGLVRPRLPCKRTW